MNDRTLDIDLSTCDREPIHIPGAIQPHGVLFALEEPGLRILRISDNSGAFFGIAPDELLERPLDVLLEPPGIALLKEALSGARPEDHNPLPLTIAGRPFDGMLHRYQGDTILELESTHALDGLPGLPPLQSTLKLVLSRLQAAPDLQTLFDTVAREVRLLTGFDRVLVYRFDKDEHGSVIAEDRDPQLEPFLGLRYPASDIPQQARRLYLLNWLRLIPNARYTPVPIRSSASAATEPLDLSMSVLRSVSPIHLEYLANMGSRSSMSISLLHEGRLWGLISCGHRTAKYLPYAMRDACELIGRVTSLQIGATDTLEYHRSFERTRTLLRQLEDAMSRADDVLPGLLGQQPDMLTLIPASGAAIVLDGRCITAGRAPDEAQLRALVQWLRDTIRSPVFFTDALPRLYPAAESMKEVASGLLAFSLPKPTPQYALWFRPEVVQTVSWGGNPHKAAEQRDGEMRLHPRRSFELWKEEVRCTSEPWRQLEVGAVGELRRYAIEIDLERQVMRAQAARAAEEASQLRFRLLRDASALLSTSLDYETTLASIVGLATDQFCDLCLLDLIDERGIVRRVRIRHADPTQQSLSERLYHYGPPRNEQGHRAEHPLLRSPLTRDALRREIAPQDDHLRLLWDDLRIRALISVQLVTRSRALGTLWFMNSEQGRRFNAKDLELAEELARRAAMALENADLYRRAQHAVDEALAAVRGREELIAIISHDLRNPLNALLLQSRLALRALAADDSQHGQTLLVRLERIQRSAEHMHTLLQNLMDMARIEAGQFAIEPVPLQVEKALTGTLEILRPLAEQKSIQLVRSPCPADLMIRADPQRFSQVLSNLIGNAIRFTPEGGTIRVSVERLGLEACFAVKDTGPGIAQENRQHLFDRYWHARPAEGGGSGLGLYIAKGIVDAHGGHIWLESEVGSGSTFYFTMQIVQ